MQNVQNQIKWVNNCTVQTKHLK